MKAEQMPEQVGKDMEDVANMWAELQRRSENGALDSVRNWVNQERNSGATVGMLNDEINRLVASVKTPETKEAFSRLQRKISGLKSEDPAVDALDILWK